MKLPPTEALISVVAPHSCLLCNREGPLVCEQCLPVFARLKKPVCFLCNSLSEDFKTCRSCSSKIALKRVWVASRYEAYVKQLIREFKFERKRAACESLAQVISDTIVVNNYDLVCSVPCATSRLRRRGFNQSDLLGRRVAKTLKVPYIDVLIRSGQAEQVGQTRSERLHQSRSLFRLVKPVKDKKILLIDDVATTGTTLNNCAHALKLGGAKRIEAAVIARG